MGVPAKPNRPGPTGWAPGSSVKILGLEVAQTIQNLRNEVPLISGKPTVVRLYFETIGFTGPETLQGELAVAASAGGPARPIASANAIAVSAAARPDLARQRRDIATSLNFVLPPEVLAWPSLVIKVHRVFSAKGEIPLKGGAKITRPLKKMPPLRVRAVGLRYTWVGPNGSEAFAPDAVHFDRLRSYLLRTYPVATIDWSQIVVPAPVAFTPPFSSEVAPGQDDPVWLAKLALVHNQLADLRINDMKSPIDRRTHYYGLISDAHGQQFFRGASNYVPRSPDPSCVAVGPAGVPGAHLFAWDTSPSYADWYGAHELGHTFGRDHPGYCQCQERADSHFPYLSGRIGDAAHGDMVGFDVGDTRLGIAMRAIGNENHHDFMTYCDDLWISAYTYENVLVRLQQEDALSAPTA